MAPSISLLARASPRSTGAITRARLEAGLAAASLQRRRLRDVRFVAVTGSAGKTTTKELIARILSDRYRVRCSPADANGPAVMAKTVLRTSRRDAFCVLEAAAGHPASMRRTARVLRADVVAVTCIGHDHRSLFRTLEATAMEKAELLRCAAPGAVAVLNADDPNVLHMAGAFPGRVITFGRSPDADLRAIGIASRWPERLSFELSGEGSSDVVSTRLCGTHWTTCVLAALGVAHAFGIPLPEAARSLAGAAPTPRRMSPLTHQGVTYIRDDVKAPLWAMDTVLDFIAAARASRRILVIGTLSDYSGKARRVYPAVARRALAVADRVLFVGPQARHALRADDGEAGDRLGACATETDARIWLDELVQPGDLVLLKGSSRADRLGMCVPTGAVAI